MNTKIIEIYHKVVPLYPNSEIDKSIDNNESDSRNGLNNTANSENKKGITKSLEERITNKENYNGNS